MVFFVEVGSKFAYQSCDISITCLRHKKQSKSKALKNVKGKIEALKLSKSNPRLELILEDHTKNLSNLFQLWHHFILNLNVVAISILVEIPLKQKPKVLKISMSGMFLL